MKNLLFLFLCLYATQNYAQDLVFSSGLNHTTYDYTNTLGETNANVNGSSGNFYEIGFLGYLGTEDRLGYTLGMSLNEFNAIGGNPTTIYVWETKYLGVKTGLSYAILVTRPGLRLSLNLALQASTIVDGEQRINGSSFDLTKEEEFNGLFLQSAAGMDISYPLTEKVRIGLGYNYGKSIKISDKTEESLSFNNHQWALNLKFRLK